MSGASDQRPAIEWQLQSFDCMDRQVIHAMLKLRIDVFVVEQQCAYAELDGLDALPQTRHLTAHIGGRLVGCARLLAPEAERPVRFGRVAVAADWRRRGIAQAMIDRLLEYSSETWPTTDVFLSAQVDASALYQGSGFQEVSTPYLDDGIAHVDMLRPASG